MAKKFHRKSIGVDAAAERMQGSERVNPKNVSAHDEGEISVRTMPGSRMPGLREVPEEYRTLQRGGRSLWGVFVFLIVLFAVSVGAFYFWNARYPQYQGAGVTMTVAGPNEAVSGDEVTFSIDYSNDDVVSLTSVELDVQWPDGFYYNTATVEPLSDRATTWKLGPLDPGGSKQIEISGQLVGRKDQLQEIVFRLSYRPANINSDFEEAQSLSVMIVDAQLDLAITTPEKVLAGENASFEAIISNTSDRDLTGLVVRAQEPRDFEVLSREPAVEDSEWKGDLAVGESVTLTVDAKADDDADGAESWVVEISQEVEGAARRLLRDDVPVTIVRPNFEIALKINGQSGDFEVEYGKTLNYQLTVTNKSSSAIEDISVSALMDSDVIDRKTVQSTGLVSNDTITWTQEHAAQLANFGPETEVLLSWKADLLEAGTIGRASVDTVITVEIEGLPEWQQRSPVTVVSVGEGLVFNQLAYWDLGGTQAGSGNLPPVTNERTEYLVIWSIDSGSQEYDSVTVSSFLPQKVSFVGEDEVDEGTVRFDEETNRLEWQINDFSTKLLPLKAAFIIKFVPVDGDEGTVMALMNPATIIASGQEVFEAKSFSVTTEQVIVGDDFAGDFGTVIQ